MNGAERVQRRAWLPILLALLTLVSAWLTASRLRISGDLATLFPDRAASLALGRFVRGFGGGDVALILLRGADAAEVNLAAEELAEGLRTEPSVASVMLRAPTRPLASFDPTLAWRYAGPLARTELKRALSPEGMKARLDGTRDMLLAPGSAEAETWLARDPLRLASIPFEGRTELAAGLLPGADGAFVADEGRARLVVLEPRGSAFDTTANGALVRDVGQAIDTMESHHPTVVAKLTGGHAIAHATKEMLIRDLEVSGTLALGLASGVFLLTFRRGRALAAVLPPLVVGTLWTTGIAALLPGGLSAIAVGFAAVVVGVGVDTSVHVYAALLEGRRQGLAPQDAARFARAQTWKPTLLAAVTAGVAFGSLALSELSAMRQLGLLCAAGEVLTALAILAITPEIAAHLETRQPPLANAPRWLPWVRSCTSTRSRARWALTLAAAPVVALLFLGWPKIAQAIVAVRPQSLAPLATQEEIYRLFGGRPGQWVVLSIDKSKEIAAERSDRIAEALEPLARDGTVEGFDALAAVLPARATQERRLAERDALDLPGRREELRAALVDRGFDPEGCAPAFAAFEHPSHDLATLDRATAARWIVLRHLATEGDDTLAATYVRPRGTREADARALAAIHAADPDAIVTGYPFLETELRAVLARDLPRIAIVALVLVALALRTMLGRARDVLLALSAIVAELACVGLAMRALHLGWHVYDALVLPVLVGVTIDESMFLLAAARDAGERVDAVDRALVAQGPLVVSTGLTTAAGFAALLACRFDGLRDLGAVGTLGVILGLAAALLVVPAGLRLAKR
jgi:predicted RND superfamily exporter protein